MTSRNHPASQDALLLIEVPDTTTEYDRTVKLPLYETHEIAEVWIFAIHESHIETYTAPSGERYTTLVTKHKGESTESGAVAGLEGAVREVAGQVT